MRIKRTSMGILLTAAACAAVIGASVQPAGAFPDAHWSVGPNDRFEVMRSHHCFGADRMTNWGGNNWYRQESKSVVFSRDVVSAEVFLSGFNLWYTGREDHEVRAERVDVIIEGIGPFPGGDIGPYAKAGAKQVKVKVMYIMRDKDPKGKDDHTEGCVGFTVIAKTK